jgi:hypothetical protein
LSLVVTFGPPPAAARGRPLTPFGCTRQ